MAQIRPDIAIVTQSYTRPADTNAYTAGDQVADSVSAPTILTFANAARFPLATGRVKTANILSSAYVATAPNFELWLFDTTFTPNNDNAAFAPTNAVMATCQAVIPVTVAYVGNPAAGASGNQWIESTEVGIPYKCAASSNSLFGVLVVRNAYVPVSAEIFTVRLAVERF